MPDLPMIVTLAQLSAVGWCVWRMRDWCDACVADDDPSTW